MTRAFVLLVTLASLLPHSRGAGAAELTSREFAAQIDNLPQDRRNINDPLTAIQNESATVRYLAMGTLDPSMSKDHEQALVATLGDDVRWLRDCRTIVPIV